MKFTAIETSSGKVHTGALGSVTVKIYEHARKVSRRGKHHGSRSVFQVVDNTHGKGRRALRGFSTFAEAAAEAARLAKLISTGQTAAATLTNADAASFGRAKELCAELIYHLNLSPRNLPKPSKFLAVIASSRPRKISTADTPLNAPRAPFAKSPTPSRWTLPASPPPTCKCGSTA